MVAQLGGLRQLRAVGCASLTDAALQHLAGLQGLLQLDLGCNARITDTGISALAGMQGGWRVHAIFYRRTKMFRANDGKSRYKCMSLSNACTEQAPLHSSIF